MDRLRSWNPVQRIHLHTRVAVLLAIAILPIGFVGVGEAVHTAREASRLARVELINRTRLAAEEGRVTLSEAFGAMDGLALALPSGSRACSRLLSDFVQSSPRYLFAALIQPDGDVDCSSAPGQARPAFLGALDIWSPQEAPRSGVQLSAYEPSLDAVVLNTYRSVYPGGEHAGTLILSLPVSLLQTLARASDSEADFHLALFDWRGNMFAEGARDLGDPGWAPANLDLRGPQALSERVFIGTSRSGEERSYAAVPMFAGDVHALGTWSRSSLESAAATRARLAVLFPTVMGLLAFAVAYFTVHWLAVRHIVYLGRVMRAFEGGRRNVRASQLQAAAPELAELGSAFDRMAETIMRDEQKLQQALEEKTALIREVYHRVKNNLQIVISLLNLQMRQAQGQRERDALARLQERVMGLAAVHQRLYLANDLTRVRCDDLLGGIVDMLLQPAAETRGPKVDRVLMPLELGPDQAIPLALIATEMITNAVKHGDATDDAKLRVVLEEAGEGKIRFAVCNTSARGSSQKVRRAALDTGVGARLIEAFARQLGGSLEVTEADGLHQVTLTFPARASGAAGDSPGPQS